MCNNAEGLRKTSQGSLFPTAMALLLIADLFTTDVAPFDLPSVHFKMIFSMASLRLSTR